jgi:para-nitrobenzyl esterase
MRVDPSFLRGGRYGKIKGITWSGIHAFKGVPYGASTAGRNRWKAQQPPASWRGERESFDYGVISPQVTTDRRSEYSSLIMWDRHVGGVGEDMLTWISSAPALRRSLRTQAA